MFVQNCELRDRRRVEKWAVLVEIRTNNCGHFGTRASRVGNKISRHNCPQTENTRK
ncbi:hypothetical protein B0H12DRAFT_1107684 [Mycena haematopus]|nr:hypothetical protein B0H12DRAFT_1107684 [Mycena haematopus]